MNRMITEENVGLKLKKKQFKDGIKYRVEDDGSHNNVIWNKAKQGYVHWKRGSQLKWLGVVGLLFRRGTSSFCKK